MATGSETIDNGTNWLVFRPPVITSGKGVYIGLGLGTKSELEIRVKDPKKLAAVLLWLEDRIGPQLNNHPVRPRYAAERLENVAIVYANERMDDAKDRLIQIPLNELVLGKKGEFLELELRALRELVGNDGSRIIP